MRLLALTVSILLTSTAILAQLAPSSSESLNFTSCNCDQIVNLTIHNGLYQVENSQGQITAVYGAQAIADEFELSVGAVTVANMNDTDGDAIIDSNDNDVLFNLNKGFEEIDLMKLVIGSGQSFPEHCTDVVVLQHTGDIAFWNTSTKGSPASLSFPLNTLPQTVYVEAISPSTTIRDINIRAMREGVVQDGVKATAIWVNKKEAYQLRTDPTNPANLGIDNSELTDWIADNGDAVDGSYYGFGSFNPTANSPNNDTYFGGRILFEFELLPNGIENELNALGIIFDIGRRIRKNRVEIEINDRAATESIIDFPGYVELFNDDGNEYLDEDTDP